MALLNTHTLVAAGPIEEASGFPLWFADENGTLLGLGLDASDPLLPARGEIPVPRPPGFGVDVPDESFYFLAEAEMEIGGGPDAPGRARLALALEAAFVADAVVYGDRCSSPPTSAWFRETRPPWSPTGRSPRS